MIRLANMNKTTRSSLFTYALVIVAFLIIQVLRGTVGIGSVLEGQLIPICAYVTMALALNLVVGVSGELSLGHAGFMSIGAFMGCSAASALAGVIPFAPLRLAVAMLVGAALAGFFGFLIGIPVLRLNGDYLAIVTLAFGEIIKSLVTNVYLGVDENGLHRPGHHGRPGQPHRCRERGYQRDQVQDDRLCYLCCSGRCRRYSVWMQPGYLHRHQV